MEIEQLIDGLLTVAPYNLSPQQRQDTLLGLLKSELEYACETKSAAS